MVTERRSARQAAWWMVCLGTGLGLALGEWILAPRLLPPPGYYVRSPGAVREVMVADGQMPGVHGTAVAVSTADGLRADPYSPDDRYRILCLGGSTTECAVLDDSEAWPHLLQDRLRAAAPELHAWVGNAGGPGDNSRQHILVMEHVVPRVPDCQAVIHLIGINDLMHSLMVQLDYQPLTPEQILTDGPSFDLAFRWYPYRGHDETWYKRTNTWQVARKAKHAWLVRHKAPELARMARQNHATQQAELRERRRTVMTALTTLPNLDDVLAEYQRNLNYLIRQAREQGVRPIFLTQPTLWHDGMPADQRARLWFGTIGPDPFQATEYYGPEALAAGMARFNAATQRVCAEQDVECLDLAPLIPKDLGSFYDDCHFNEPGARQVADAVAEYLLARSPFANSEDR